MDHERNEAVRERDRRRCANCRASGPEVTLDVHHIVPRGRGGSDRMSNLVLLCRRCHDAAHGKGTAPTVEFESTGDMDTDSFDLYLEFFWELPTARFDGENKVWRVPKADFEEFVEDVRDSQKALADGGGE